MNSINTELFSILGLITNKEYPNTDNIKHIYQFYNEFDKRFNDFLEGNIIIADFNALLGQINEICKDFLSKNNPDLPISFFAFLYECSHLKENLFNNLAENFSVQKFSNLDEEEQELFLNIDNILIAFVNKDDYLNDLTDRDIEAIDLVLITDLKLVAAEELIINKFHEHPSTELLDLNCLAKIGSDKSDHLLDLVAFSGKYELKAEILAIILILVYRKKKIQDLIENKSAIWQELDVISGKYLFEIMSLFYQNDPSNTNNPGLEILAYSDIFTLNYFAVKLIYFYKINIDFIGNPVMNSLINNQEINENVYGEESYIIAEEITRYFSEQSDKVLDKKLTDRQYLNDFLCLALLLPESVFYYLIPVIQRVESILYEENQFIEIINTLLKSDALVKFISSKSKMTFSDFYHGNIQTIANLMNLEVMGTNFATLSIN